MDNIRCFHLFLSAVLLSLALAGCVESDQASERHGPSANDDSAASVLPRAMWNWTVSVSDAQTLSHLLRQNATLQALECPPVPKWRVESVLGILRVIDLMGCGADRGKVTSWIAEWDGDISAANESFERAAGLASHAIETAHERRSSVGHSAPLHVELLGAIDAILADVERQSENAVEMYKAWAGSNQHTPDDLKAILMGLEMARARSAVLAKLVDTLNSFLPVRNECGWLDDNWLMAQRQRSAHQSSAVTNSSALDNIHLAFTANRVIVAAENLEAAVARDSLPLAVHAARERQMHYQSLQDQLAAAEGGHLDDARSLSAEEREDAVHNINLAVTRGVSLWVHEKVDFAMTVLSRPENSFRVEFVPDIAAAADLAGQVPATCPAHP